MRDHYQRTSDSAVKARSAEWEKLDLYERCLILCVSERGLTCDYDAITAYMKFEPGDGKPQPPRIPEPVLRESLDDLAQAGWLIKVSGDKLAKVMA